jgi:hypothetical protein
MPREGDPVKFKLPIRHGTAAIACSLLLMVGTATAAEGLDPTADEILRSMSTFLASQQAFSVSTDISTEIITQEGQKLQLNAHSDLLLQRPSSFYAARRGRFADLETFFDGRQLTLYGKTLGAYVQRDLPGTIDDAIGELEAGRGPGLPASDLLLSDPYRALANDVTGSGYFGRAFIGGVECHHIAFREADVDWQLWVKVGDEPLPMKYVITTKWMTGAPQFSVQLSNWNLKPAIKAGRFTFVPPSEAMRVEVLPVDETGEVAAAQEDQ